MAKFCINCGKEIAEGSNVCPSCGTPVNGAQATPTQTVVVNAAQPKQSNGMALAGFIISLVSTILCCGSLNWLSLIFSIIGVVKAKDVNGNGKGLAIAGIIISCIGLILTILFFVLGSGLAVFDEIANSSTYGY